MDKEKNISVKKQALIEKRLKGFTFKNVGTESKLNKPLSSSDESPLSFIQESFWVFDKLSPTSISEVISFAVDLKGLLNYSAMERAITKVIERHKILRSTVKELDGRLTQTTSKNLRFSLMYQTKLEVSSNITSYIRTNRQKIDLSDGSLFTASIVEMGRNDHTLIFSIHHIAFDEWSINIFLRELSELYTAFVAGHNPDLPNPSIQYSDYAAWQRRHLPNDQVERHLDYWRKQLANVPQLLELPTQQPRPMVQSFKGETHMFAINANIWKRFLAVCQEARITPFIGYLTSFIILIQRYTSREDIVVGSTASDRDQVELENLIGPLFNILPIKVSMSSSSTVRSLFQSVSQVVAESIEHRKIPFTELVSSLGIERSSSFQPLIQVMFAYRDKSDLLVSMPELEVKEILVRSEFTTLDFALSVVKTSNDVICCIDYSTDLFASDFIERLGTHYITLLESITEDWNKTVARLPILTPTEKRQILTTWNDTRVEYIEACIHELFRKQAEKTPEAVAVVFEKKKLTYQELNFRSNQLAHYLRALGVGSEVLVGICIDRSLEMIIGLLAILKAGGAYVPLDPNYPRARLTYIIKDSEAKILLTQQSLKSLLKDCSVQIVCIDTDWSKVSKESVGKLFDSTSPDNLAYVNYTSGSTGEPKGVMIEHNSVANLLKAMRDSLGTSAKDRLLSLTTISFDISVLEIFLPLTTGARLYLARQEDVFEKEKLLRLVEKENINVIQATPVSWQIIVDSNWANNSNLRILCGGEAISEKLAEKLIRIFGSFWNLYGPTETTIWSTVFHCVTASKLSIGRPIMNTQIYILDSNLNPVPIGVVGELYVAGIGLARGYLNRHELTIEKFIPNPFNGNPGTRMYKTGDLARYLPDGNVEYIGRTDYQVKIRGFRVELAEIEAALETQPAVRQAIVVMREDKLGDKRLLAYIVPQKEQPISTELQTHLREKLPTHMIPSTFVMLDKLPLTSNGKVDRKALPIPNIAQSELANTYIAPRNSIEEVLVTIWKEILEVDKVGVLDNFFELGGHSLLFLQVSSRAEQFGINIPPSILFRNQTVAELALNVSDGSNLNKQGPVETRNSKTLTSIPLTFWQKNFFSQNLGDYNFFGMSVGLQVNESINKEILQKAVAFLIDYHDALRTRFYRTGQDWNQVVVPYESNRFFSSINLSWLGERDHERIITFYTEQAKNTFHLSRGPLIQIVHFALSSDKSIIVILINHMIADRFSLDIITQDLEYVYKQLTENRRAELPHKSTSLKLWVRKQIDYMNNGLNEELQYWLELSSKEGYPLPVDHIDIEKEERFEGDDTYFISLSPIESASLNYNITKFHSATLKEVFLAAMFNCLTKWSGRSRHTINWPSHGRNPPFTDVNLIRTVGYIHITTPVCLDVTYTPTPSKYLKTVIHQLRQVPNEGSGFTILQAYHQNPEVRLRLESFLRQSEVTINFFGLQEGHQSSTKLFRPLGWPNIGTVFPVKNRIRLLISSQAEGGLNFGWNYSPRYRSKATIQKLAQEYVGFLKHFTEDDSDDYSS